MTARDYPCPDCEDALGPCSGLGCPAKGMERFAVSRPKAVCSVPEPRKPTPRREFSVNKTVRRVCLECEQEFAGIATSKWCGDLCRKTARKRYDAEKWKARKAAS